MSEYIQDPDLEFLRFCDNEDLKVLVDLLTKGKNGEDRFTEGLTLEERFKKCGSNYRDVWDLIATELQHFGGDTLPNLLRGHGVRYRELLMDASKKLNVDFDREASTIDIENQLLLKVLSDSLEKMSDIDKRDFAKEMNMNTMNLDIAAMMIALQMAIKTGGFASYKIALIVANAVAKQLTGRGLTLAFNAGISRSLAIFAGPIGWVISAILTVPIITGPAFRVTIPCSITVAYLRRKYINRNFLK